MLKFMLYYGIQAKRCSGTTDVPILAFAISGFGGSMSRSFCHSPRKENCTHCRESLESSRSCIERYEEEKNSLSLSVFITQAVPPAESNGRMKEKFGICGWK
jgi:hypothetical protein